MNLKFSSMINVQEIVFLCSVMLKILMYQSGLFYSINLYHAFLDNKLFDNADTLKSQIVQLEIQTLKMKQV